MEYHVAPLELYDEEHDVAVQCHNSNTEGILFFYVYKGG